METVINFIHSLNPQYFGIAVAVVMLIVTALFAALANSMMTSDSLKKKCVRGKLIKDLYNDAYN